MDLGADLKREHRLQARLQALRRLTHVVGEAVDLADMLQGSRETFPALVDGTRAVLFFLVEENTEMLHPLFLQRDDPLMGLLVNVLDRPLSEIRFPLSVMPVEWSESLARGQAYIDTNLAELVRQGTGQRIEPALLHQFGLYGVVVLPLRSGGLLRGLVVLTLEREQVDAEDVDLGMDAANLIAARLEKDALIDQTHRQVCDLERLFNLAQAMGQSAELHKLADIAARQFIHTLRLDQVSIVLWNRPGNTLLPLVELAYDYETESFSVSPQREAWLDSPVACQVVASGSTMQVLSGELADGSPEQAYAQALGVRMLAAVPLLHKGECIGAVELRDALRSQRLSSHQLNLAMTLAGVVAAALANAQLYETVVQHINDLEDAYTRLQLLDRLKDEMIRNVSHEMRTPLTFVLAYVQLLQDEAMGPLTEMQRSSLEVVGRRAVQLDQLIGNMVALETVRREKLDLQPVDMGVLVHELVERHRPLALDAGIDLQEEIALAQPVVHIDEQRMRQVMNNLLSNAIKFSPDGGAIIVRVADESDWLRVEVVDTGTGIPPDKLGMIFERFYQVDGSTRRRFGGAGLGLAVVKQAVEAHGGRVGVHSDQGHGSCFFFIIPRHPAPPEDGA